jgi:hypothetical protein
MNYSPSSVRLVCPGNGRLTVCLSCAARAPHRREQLAPESASVRCSCGSWLVPDVAAGGYAPSDPVALADDPCPPYKPHRDCRNRGTAFAAERDD